MKPSRDITGIEYAHQPLMYILAQFIRQNWGDEALITERKF